MCYTRSCISSSSNHFACLSYYTISSIVQFQEMSWLVGLTPYRGAQGSKGRTSWTAKPEQADYISFVGFMTSYLLSLSDSTSAEHKGHATSTNHGGIDLILGGYSYGSLIVTRLPPMQDILRSFQDPAPDTAMSDVVQKASQLAVETRSRVSNTSNGRSGSTIASTKAEHSNRVSRSPVVYGENKGRRKSRESDRESVEGLANPSTDVPQPDHRSSCPKPVQEDNEHLRQFRVQYLLISPLLPPVSFLLSPSLGSQFGGFGRSTELVSDATLTSHPTLAVFGSDDLFTSASKLQAWAKEMQMSSKGIFEWLEVDGAGHFWREHGVEDEMRERVARWASR